MKIFIAVGWILAIWSNGYLWRLKGWFGGSIYSIFASPPLGFIMALILVPKAKQDDPNFRLQNQITGFCYPVFGIVGFIGQIVVLVKVF